MTPLKGKDGGLLLIHVVNNKYFPVIDLNWEELKQQFTPIKFGISKKQQGPVRYEKEPSIDMILYMYLPTYFVR